MNLERVQELMTEADEERLSYGEISEIEAAFAEVPDHMLRDLRDNASVVDMLIEIEEWIKFGAILAKNNIAEELASDEINKNYILSELEFIERLTGTGNQPSARDSYENA